MDDPTPKRLLICINRRPNPTQPSCAARGSVEIADAIDAEIAARGLNISVERIVCLAQCHKGPTLRLAGEEFIQGATSSDIEDILRRITASSA